MHPRLLVVSFVVVAVVAATTYYGPTIVARVFDESRADTDAKVFEKLSTEVLGKKTLFEGRAPRPDPVTSAASRAAAALSALAPLAAPARRTHGSTRPGPCHALSWPVSHFTSLLS